MANVSPRCEYAECDMDVGPTGIASRFTGGVPAADPLEHASVSVPVAPDSVPPVAVRLGAVSPSSRGPALFWRVAIGNAAVLAAACVITAIVFAPSGTDVALRELAIFGGSL